MALWVGNRLCCNRRRLMARDRVLVQFPLDVIAAVDEIAGAGRRTAFLVDLARREIKLHRQLLALRAAKGAWNREDHPELAQGADQWVRQIRSLDEERFQELEDRRDRK